MRTLIAAALVVGLVRPAGAAAAPIPHFTDVTAASGIHVTGLGNASAWIDVDGDGDLDLLATNSSIPTAETWLYRNDGAGQFTDITQQAGLGSASIRSAAWGDYDNDGHPDLAATGYASGGRTQLFHNDGDGTFTEVGRAAGMKTAGIPWRVAWGDYDRDGFLDLYQANLGSDYL